MKITPESIPNLIKSFLQDFPQHAQGLGADTGEVLQTFLKFCLDKHGILTREEFEIQSKVLEKTRLKLEQLEAKVKTLENQSTTD